MSHDHSVDLYRYGIISADKLKEMMMQKPPQGVNCRSALVDYTYPRKVRVNVAEEIGDRFQSLIEKLNNVQFVKIVDTAFDSLTRIITFVLLIDSKENNLIPEQKIGHLLPLADASVTDVNAFNELHGDSNKCGHDWILTLGFENGKTIDLFGDNHPKGKCHALYGRLTDYLRRAKNEYASR